jgi:hypothetical protein
MLPASYGGDDMRHATPDQLKEVFVLFRAYPAIFPHIRQDALSRRIAAGQCIYEDGVAITYQQYKKRTRVGDVDVPAGAVMLHQIVLFQELASFSWGEKTMEYAVLSPAKEYWETLSRNFSTCWFSVEIPAVYLFKLIDSK